MKVSHVILRVSDMDRSVAFFRDAVGLVTLAEGPEFSFFDAGSIQLALSHADTIAPDTSLTEIVLEADDVVGAYEAMAGRGVEFRVELRPVMTDGGRSLHAADFTDPDGHVVSLTGWRDDP